MAKKDDITSTEKLLELIRNKGEEPSDAQAGEPVKRKLFQSKTKPGSGRGQKSTSGRHSKKDIRIGVDINESGITLAAIERLSENRQKLLGIRRIARDPEIKRGSDEFVKLLKGVLKEFAAKYKDAAFWATISSADVETRFLQIPKVPSRQVANAVRFAFLKESSIADSQIFDYHEIETAYADGEQKQNVIAYTAPKSEVSAVKELFDKAGWPLKGISIVPFAIQNLLKAGWLKSSGKNVCTLFIGRDWSRITIFSKSVLVLSRDIKAGARSMVQAILESLDKSSPPPTDNLSLAVPEEELPPETTEASPNLGKAEELFLAFLQAGASVDGDQATLKREKLVFAMCKPALDRVIRQVEMTLEHFGLNFDDKPIDTVYISGELSSKQSVVNYIGKQLGFPVEPMDPFGNAPAAVIAGTPGTGDIFVPAAGMALSENEITPNFIFTYVDKSKKAFAKKFNLVANIVFIGLICLAMGVFYFQTEKVKAIKAATRPLQAELDAYSPKLDRNLMASVTGQTVNKMQAFSTAADHYLPVAVISELSALTPETVKLTSVQAIMGAIASQKIVKSDKILNIEGLIYGNNRVLERNVTEYLVRLKKSALFKQPKIKEKLLLETGQGPALRFIISMSII